METSVVVFTKNNARVLTNPPNLKELGSFPNVVINPDLKFVEGIPPHFWKLKDGRIVSMDEWEKSVRLKSINKGVHNRIEPLDEVHLGYNKPFLSSDFKIYIAALFGIFIGLLASFLK